MHFVVDLGGRPDTISIDRFLLFGPRFQKILFFQFINFEKKTDGTIARATSLYVRKTSADRKNSHAGFLRLTEQYFGHPCCRPLERRKESLSSMKSSYWSASINRSGLRESLEPSSELHTSDFLDLPLDHPLIEVKKLQCP